MAKLPLIVVALLATTGCGTKNYYYGADGKPVPAPAEAMTPPPPPVVEEAKPEPKPAPKGHYPVYGGKAHPRVYDEPVAPATKGDRRVPPADWDPNSGMPEEPAYAPPPPPHAMHEPAVGAKDDGKYVWNKNRTELKAGERYHRPTPPGAAGLNNGELIDPLSFPHFCGPGARSRGAC